MLFVLTPLQSNLFCLNHADFSIPLHSLSILIEHYITFYVNVKHKSKTKLQVDTGLLKNKPIFIFQGKTTYKRRKM